MKILLILAPLLVGIIAAVATAFVIGAVLPRHHTATRSVRLAASPDAVWALLTDIPSQPSWRTKLTGVERLPDENGHAVWKEVRSDGWGMPLRVEMLDPPRKMVTRVADEKLPFGGTWTYEIRAENGMTRLRITEEGDIKIAPFRYLSAFMDKSGTIRQYLADVCARLGESAAIEP